jgi:small nuclear ribonucleoprotein (snRNP)-like protein
MEWIEWEKKRIFVKLKDGDCYTGAVTDVDEKKGFITILDKYNERVALAISEIKKIKEENGGIVSANGRK